MTLAEKITNAWMEYIAYLDRVIIQEDVNDFCNIESGNYEEYMTIWNIMMGVLDEGYSEMPKHNR